MDKMDQLVTIQTARLARDKGFDWPTRFADYKGFTCDSADPQYKVKSYKNTLDNDKFVSLPTYNTLQTWLRHEHLIHIVINPSFGYVVCKLKSIEGGIDKSKRGFVHVGRDKFETYEAALIRGLWLALNLVPVNQNIIS